MAQAVILSGVRTPIGNFLGSLSSLSSPELGAVAIREAVTRAEVSADQVDEVIMGCVLPAGVGQAPARQASIKGGIPSGVPALTINKVCGSGLMAVMLADRSIRAGESRLVLAGGMESMSNAPYLVRGLRSGVKFGNQPLVDGMIHDGLWCGFNDCHMGIHAEYTAETHGVSRADQDQFAALSQQRASSAQAAGHFTSQIASVTIPGKKGPTTVSLDEGIRAESSAESLAKLRPAFKGDGSVTAGNASTLSDGAAALVVADHDWAQQQGRRPLATIRSQAIHAAEPRDLFVAPAFAVRRAMEKAGWTPASVDLFEINEAFASQMVACIRKLEIDPARVNVDGGAIALGHPIGASGARVLVTLLHALRRRGLKRGIASLCLGGGEAVALAVEIV
jgi:acetyl-CoA C-acetyltransferase